MSDPTDAPAGAGATALDRTPASEGPTAVDLGNFLTKVRENPEPAESAEPATAEPESPAPKAETAAPEKDPGETTEATEPAELPPIEPPRSWTQAEKERFQSLPRETQEYLHTREQERDRDHRRGQNELAEQRKAVDAEREAAVQDRRALAAKLPEVQRAIHEFLADKYPDIKTMDDVTRMAREAERLSGEDPFTSLQIANRLKAWEVDQRRIQLAMSDAQAAQAGEVRERELNLLKFRADETSKLAEFFPEIKDPDKLKTLTDKAVTHLKSFEFSDQHLNEFAAQGDKPFIFSAGFQRILLNSLKYEELQKVKAVAAAKPVPPVQRPGASRPVGSDNSDSVKDLKSKLRSSGDPKDLGALIGALRRA